MRRHLLALGLVTFAIASASPSTLDAQSQAQRAEVMATINGFLRGLKTKDTVLMTQHLDTLTRMTLLRPGPNGTRVVVLKGSEFIKVAANPNQPPLDEPIRNPVVQIDGDLASVWTEYQVRRDGKVTHCGYDAFQLARLGGKWKILNVTDSFRQTGCGEPWP
jgi:hypothetical protein